MSVIEPSCFLKKVLLVHGSCSSTLTSIEELRGSQNGRKKLKAIVVFFNQFEGFSKIPETGFFCKKCDEEFTKQQSNFCKSPIHPDNIQRKTEPKRMKFVTATNYFAKFKEMGLKPGEGYCKTLCQKIEEMDQELEAQVDLNFDPPPCKKSCLREFNKARVQAKGLPIIKFGKRNNSGQALMASRAIDELSKKFRQNFRDSGLYVKTSVGGKRLRKLTQDSQDLNRLMNSLKLRMQDCSKAEQRSLLTFSPPSWNLKTCAAFFEVPLFLVRASRKHLKETNVVLPPAKFKTGRKIDSTVKAQVLEFYRSPDISRECPGKKDVVSVKSETTGKRDLVQKRYLVNNIREIYQQFKLAFPLAKIGKSSFFCLRPQECFSLSSKGYHNVCLCVYHENLKLLFLAIKSPSIHPFMDSLVCVDSGKLCFYRRCFNCKTNIEIVGKMIEEQVAKSSKEIISYQRWSKTDGVDRHEVQKTKLDFTQFAVAEMESIARHHYITKAQNAHFKYIKDHLKPNELLVQGDFAENYSLLIQDSIQAEYFSNKQVTLHPFHILWSYEGKIQNLAIVIVSNSTLHDTNAVFAFQKTLLDHIQVEFEKLRVVLGLQIPPFEFIHYFSDGCAAQYKNRKNFCNLYYHKDDFKIPAEWNFFSTAHGKGPCDGHGGTTKRLLTLASKRGEMIRSAEDVFNFLTHNLNIINIEYLYVSENQIEEIVSSYNLVERYGKLSTIQGTQQAHRVERKDGKLILYEISKDTEPLAVKIMQSEQIIPAIHLDEASLSDWVACVYDRKWYIAIIDDINLEDQEVFVSFWKRNSKKTGTSFVRENQSIWVPFSHIISKLDPPKASRNGRTISVEVSVQAGLDTILQNFLC